MDTDSFILSVNKKDIIKDSKNLDDIFDLSNIDKNHELFSDKNKKVIGKFKIETPKNIWIDEFICLRSKMYAFKCGDDSKHKLKGISKSQSKKNKFEEYKKCLDGEEYQEECNNYILRSINHELHLEEIKKSTLSIRILRKKQDTSKTMTNLKNTFYADKEIREIMKKDYQIKLSIFSKTIIDIMMNFSTYTNILTGYSMM